MMRLMLVFAVAVAMTLTMAVPDSDVYSQETSVRIAKKQRKKIDTEDTGETTHSGKRIVDVDDVVLRDSSEYWRQNQKGSLTLELIGFAPFMGNGFAGGYYLDPDNLLEVSSHSAELSLGFIKFSSSLFELRWKRWWGNSFYTNLGIASRTIAGEATLEPLTGNDDLKSSVSVTSLGATVAIGNRWQWEYFTIGCDWIGTFVPLSKGEVEITNSKGAREEEIDDAKKDTERLAFQDSGMALRFYIGFSF